MNNTTFFKTSVSPRGKNIAIFVEDPGAANFIMAWPAELASQQCRAEIFATGTARTFLRRRDIVFHDALHLSSAAILDRAPWDLIVVGTAENQQTVGLQLIDHARRSHIPSIGVVDARMHSDLRWRGESNQPLHYAPEYLLVPDEWTKQAYSGLGFPAAKCFVVGYPHHEALSAQAARLQRAGTSSLRRRLLSPLPDSSQPVIVILTEGSANRARPGATRQAENMLNRAYQQGGRTESYLDLVLQAVSQLAHSPYLILRLHPKDQLSDYAALLPRFSYVSHTEDPHEIIFCADVVTGSTSILLGDAALLGIPALSIMFDPAEKQLLPVTVTTALAERAAIAENLNMLLTTPSPVGIIPPPGEYKSLEVVHHILHITARRHVAV